MAFLTRLSILTAVVLALSSGAAKADKIDGSWCSPSGKSMTIEGSRVITPGGRTVQGRYTRHHFDYVVPDGDANAGNRISADQIDDENIQVTVTRTTQQTPGSPEIWKRCNVVS